MKLGRAATEKAAAVLHPGRQTAATVLRAITQQLAARQLGSHAVAEQSAWWKIVVRPRALAREIDCASDQSHCHHEEGEQRTDAAPVDETRFHERGAHQ